MTNEEHRLETPEAFDARVHAELSAVEARIRDEAMSPDDAHELRTLYTEKHMAEKEFNTAPMSLDEFLEFKAAMNFNPVRTEVPAIPEAPEHAPRVTEAPEAILDVAATLSPSDEAPPSAPENDNWRIIVDHINNVSRFHQERKPAERYLNKDGVVEFKRADAIETELAGMQDERILTREEIEKKRALEAEYKKIIDEEARATRDADMGERKIDGTLDLVFREFDQLPEELQGAIRTTDEAVLRKYKVNIWASQEVRGEIFRREREDERIAHLRRKDEERVQQVRMTPKALVRALNTPEFATYSKKELVSILEAEGIAADNIPAGLRVLEARYAPRAIDPSHYEIAPVPSFEDIVSSGIEAGVQAELSAKETSIVAPSTSNLPVSPPEGKGMMSPEVKETIAPETAPQLEFVPPTPEKLTELVSTLNDTKKAIDETYDAERKNKDGKAGEEEARKARRNRDKLNTIAQRTALEIAGKEALFGAVKLPDLAAIEVYQKAVPKGLKGDEKRKAEATLGKDVRDAYYDAIRRKLAFTRSLTEAGVSKDAAEHLFREFARHAKGFEKIVAETKEGDGAKLRDGYGRHMLDWHGLKAPTLEEIREKMAEALLAYNTVPPHVEPARSEVVPPAPIVVVPEVLTDEDALDEEPYPPYSLVPESYDEVPPNPDAIYGGDIFAPLTDAELLELKKMRKSRDVDERAPYEMLEGNEDESLGDSRVRMPMTKRDGAKKDPLAVDVLRNTMSARAARANEEMESLDPTSRRYVTTKKTEAWEAMTPEDKKAMIERHFATFVTDGRYLVDLKNGNAPEEWNYLGIDDNGNVGFVDNDGGAHSFGVEQLEGIDPIVMTLQSAPTTPQFSPREYAEKKREGKRNVATRAQMSDMQKRAGVSGFSNRQLEDMEEDGVFERMKPDNSIGDFEGTEEGRKNREKWQIADVTAKFQQSKVLSFNDVKAVLGVGRNPTQHVLDMMTERGLIAVLQDGNYAWTPKAESPAPAPVATEVSVSAPTEATPSAAIESAPKVKSFKTAKGSIYTYLPDGKISRFKTATGEQMEAQDVIVFVGLTPEEEQRILYALDQPDLGEYVTLAEFEKTGPVRIVSSASDISNPESLYLCVVRDNKIVLHKPVTQTPTVGLQTFDTRAFEKNGKPWMSMHLGNKVTEIAYEDDAKTPEDAGAYIYETAGLKAGEAVIATIAGVDYPGVLRAFTKDGTHAFIEGSNTGIPIGSIHKEEATPITAEQSEAIASSELDEVGELWASFIEREYGLDINGKPITETVAGVSPKSGSAERIPLDIDLHELEKLGAELEEMATSEATPAPEASPTDERIPVPIHFGVAKQFETKFGIGENQLGLLETFSALSPAKQLLVLKNMEQATLADITEEAKKRQQEEWGGKPKWKRALQSIFTLGLVKDYQVRKIEQELLAKGKGIDATFAEGDRILAKKLSTIEQLAKVAAAGPEVEMEGDNLLIKYVSPEDLFASLGDKRLTSEKLKALEDYNNTATAFAKLPHEWTYRDWGTPGMIGRAVNDSANALGLTKRNPTDFERFEKTKLAHETARAALLSVLAERFGELGAANPEVAAMRKMNQLDEQVSLNQLFNRHPDAETALQSIQDTSAIAYAAKEFWRSKGKFVAAGALARGTTIAVVGAIAAPLAPAALIAVGVGAYGAVTGIGAGVGFQIGRRQGNELIKERRASGRMSEEDMREEIEFTTYKKTADGKPELNDKGEKIPVGKGKRRIREFTDAVSFVDRIDRLIARLSEESDPVAKALIEKKITQTTSLMAARLRHGMINFGGSSLDHADSRKGASIANRLSFIQAISRGVIETTIDKEKLDSASERLLNLRLTKIEAKRKKEIERIASVAAGIRGGFAFGGAMLADYAHGFSTKGDFDFMKKIGSAHEESMIEPGAGEIPKESFPGAIISQAEVDYGYAMHKLLGNRLLSIEETRALWHTEPDTPNPDSAFYDTPRGQAHIKLIEALLVKDPVKSPPLTAAEINEIYKSVEFDVMSGKKLPHELPGYVQKPVVIWKHPSSPASTSPADAMPTPVPPKPAASAPDAVVSGPKLSEAERLEQVQRDAIKLQREEAVDEIAKRAHKETLDQAARAEAEAQASAEYRARMERYGASDGRYLHRPNEADWANQSRVAPPDVPVRPSVAVPQAPHVISSPVESAPRMSVPHAPQAAPSLTIETPEKLPGITPPAPSGDLDSKVEEALRAGRS